jgi:hypothetical protein
MKVIPLAMAIAAVAGLSYAAYEYAGFTDGQPVHADTATVDGMSGAEAMGALDLSASEAQARSSASVAIQGSTASRAGQPRIQSTSVLDSPVQEASAANEPHSNDSPGVAQQTVAGGREQSASDLAQSPRTAYQGHSYRPSTERGRLAGELVQRWSGYVQQLYGTGAMEWAGAMADTFAEADLENLKQAAGRETYEAMMGTLLGQGTSDEKVVDMIAKSGGGLSSVQVLGSAANDLVYTMVSPCRIMDTRNAIGRLSGGVARGFFVHGANFTAQGGSSTSCGIPADPSAVAINVVAVTPDNSGFMTLYPAGTLRPTASSMNYEGGKILANEVIAKTTLGQTNDLEIYSQYGTDVVIDIVGYFMAPVATALSCLTTAEGTNTSIAAGGSANIFAPSCPAGYTSVGVQCHPDTFNLTLVGMWDSHCNYKNNTAGAIGAAAANRCCRVPGR